MLKLQAIIACDCDCDTFYIHGCEIQTWSSIPVSADGKLNMTNAFIPCPAEGYWVIGADGKTLCPNCAAARNWLRPPPPSNY